MNWLIKYLGGYTKHDVDQLLAHNEISVKNKLKYILAKEVRAVVKGTYEGNVSEALAVQAEFIDRLCEKCEIPKIYNLKNNEL